MYNTIKPVVSRVAKDRYHPSGHRNALKKHFSCTGFNLAPVRVDFKNWSEDGPRTTVGSLIVLNIFQKCKSNYLLYQGRLGVRFSRYTYAILPIPIPTKSHTYLGIPMGIPTHDGPCLVHLELTYCTYKISLSTL